MSDKLSVYLESSFISYLANDVSDDLIVAGQQKVSRNWWENNREEYELFASALVIDEVSKGDVEASAKRLDILKYVTILEVTEDARKLALYYVEQRIIPLKAFDDAVHLSVALLNGIDYLLSWNCKHIVNPVIERKLKVANDTLNLQTPYICTPLSLLGRNEND